MQALEQPISAVSGQVSLFPESKKMQFVIDRDELLNLREMKLISASLYVFLAIKLTYESRHPSIDIPSFCAHWDIEESELQSAIAQLHKKKVLEPQIQQLTLEIF